MQNKEKIKDCSTCKYGQYNDFWDQPFCYGPSDCKNWNKWEEEVKNDKRDSNRSDK